MDADDRWFEESDEDLGDDEFPDEDDLDDEATVTVRCGECGAAVYEEAWRCPFCGNYVVHESSLWSGRPGWWILLGLLGILAVIVVLAGLALW